MSNDSKETEISREAIMTQIADQTEECIDHILAIFEAYPSLSKSHVLMLAKAKSEALEYLEDKQKRET